MIERIDPISAPDKPVVEPIARPRLLTPVEREAERRRREEQRRRKRREPPSGGSETPAPRLDIRA